MKADLSSLACLVTLAASLGCAPIDRARHPQAPDGEVSRIRLAASVDRASASFDAQLALGSITRDDSDEIEDLGEAERVDVDPGELCLTVEIQEEAKDDSGEPPPATQETLCFSAKPGSLYDVNASRQEDGTFVLWISEWQDYSVERKVETSSPTKSSAPKASTEESAPETAPQPADAPEPA